MQLIIHQALLEQRVDVQYIWLFRAFWRFLVKGIDVKKVGEFRKATY